MLLQKVQSMLVDMESGLGHTGSVNIMCRPSADDFFTPVPHCADIDIETAVNRWYVVDMTVHRSVSQPGALPGGLDLHKYVQKFEKNIHNNCSNLLLYFIFSYTESE